MVIVYKIWDNEDDLSYETWYGDEVDVLNYLEEMKEMGDNSILDEWSKDKGFDDGLERMGLSYNIIYNK